MPGATPINTTFNIASFSTTEWQEVSTVVTVTGSAYIAPYIERNSSAGAAVQMDGVSIIEQN